MSEAFPELINKRNQILDAIYESESAGENNEDLKDELERVTFDIDIELGAIALVSDRMLTDTDSQETLF